jgi:hypothetical protein
MVCGQSFDEHIVLDKKILHLPNGSKRHNKHLNKLGTMAKDLNDIGTLIHVKVKVINGHVNEFA